MSVYKTFNLLVFNRECMERNVMTFRILSSSECFYVIFKQNDQLFLPFSVNCSQVANNASLCPHGQWEGGGKGGQPNVDRPGQGQGVRKIPKFVRTSFMDDPIYCLPTWQTSWNIKMEARPSMLSWI